MLAEVTAKKKHEEALKITAEQKIATVTLIPLQKIHKKRDTAWKVFKFEVFLVRIFPRSDWIRTRKITNTDTFHAAALTIPQLTKYFLPTATQTKKM